VASCSLVQIDREPGSSEKKDYDELYDCAMRLNLGGSWWDIISIVAGIMHLGNMEFVPQGDGGSAVSPGSADAARYAAQLLGFEETKLQHALTHHTIKIARVGGKGEETSSPLSPSRATDSRNGACVGGLPCMTVPSLRGVRSGFCSCWCVCVCVNL
jgi:myosin heavy subunit